MGDLYNPFPKLPKNIRQIGDPDQVIRFYMEDYVNTYLKRLYPSGSQTLRVGLLLGSVEQYDGTPYVFVDGAMEMEDVENDGEKIVFTESGWKKAYQAMEEAFPKRTIQGWFLCGGPGSQLSPLNYWKQHCQYFAGKNQLMYLNHGLEGEEVIYVTSEDGFYRLKGHCVYYERNQMMQDYMITRKDVRRVETGSHEKVIRDFRQRMVVKKEQADMELSLIHISEPTRHSLRSPFGGCPGRRSGHGQQLFKNAGNGKRPYLGASRRYHGLGRVPERKGQGAGFCDRGNDRERVSHRGFAGRDRGDL